MHPSILKVVLLGYMTNFGTGAENIQYKARISYSSRKWQSTEHTHTHTQWWYAKGILVPTELIAKAGTIWENKYWLITQSMKKYLWVSADINDWINKCGRRDTFLRQKSYKWWNRYSILKDINRKSLLTHCVLLLETFFLIVQKEEKREE